MWYEIHASKRRIKNRHKILAPLALSCTHVYSQNKKDEMQSYSIFRRVWHLMMRGNLKNITRKIKNIVGTVGTMTYMIK